MANITGKQDGKNGRNEHYDVGKNRKNVPRNVVVKEVEKGMHQQHHIYERAGQKYVRDNPEGNKKDNVNR